MAKAKGKIQYVSSDSNGLLVIVEHSDAGARSHTSHRYNVTEEEYFRYNWPAGAKIIDTRDAMHKRGWTYFRITGHINGEEVTGAGRIPFVYAAARGKQPWLRLNVAHRLEITDSAAGTGIYNADRGTFTTYPVDAFFKGLARPWMGLHTIDIIRRDAAEQQLRFETKYTPGSPRAEVIVAYGQNRIVYAVDMERDVVDKITLLTSKGTERGTKAELKFFYLDDVTQAGVEFTEPSKKIYGKPQRQGLGMLWLVWLAEGGLN